MKVSYDRARALERLSSFGLLVEQEGPALPSVRLALGPVNGAVVYPPGGAFAPEAERRLLNLLHVPDMPLPVMWNVLLHAARSILGEGRSERESASHPELLQTQLARQVSPAVLALAADTVNTANLAFAPVSNNPVSGLNLGVAVWAGVQRLRTVADPYRNYNARIALPVLGRMSIGDGVMVEGRNAAGLAFNQDRPDILILGVDLAVAATRGAAGSFQTPNPKMS